MHPRWKVGTERHQEVMVALSESVMKNRLKRPLAEKSHWRHIRLALKPHYIENHASLTKSYYGTLSGSHGRFFRFRHENSPEVPPSVETTMTSYPLVIKPRYLGNHVSHTKLLWNTIRKSWSLVHNPSWKFAGSAPWRINHDNVISGLQ